MKNSSHAIQRTLAVAIAAGLFSAAALADRPMVTDSANTNKAGSGHVEAWLSNLDSDFGSASGLSVAPAYAFADGVQVGGIFARLSGGGETLTNTGVNLKWRITPSNPNGCNFGAKFEYARVKFKDDFGNSASGNASGVTGLGTCNFTQGGSLHMNLGFVKPSGGSSVTAWGLGYEHKFGAITPHIEINGIEDSDEVVTIGLRGDISANVQLDGSFSSVSGVKTTTVGVKFRF
jgi:hypothetical protein